MFGLKTVVACALTLGTILVKAQTPLLNSSATVVSPPLNATMRFDGSPFNFTYYGIGGEQYHTTGVQVQFVTQAIGLGVRAAGLPDNINGYARTTKATIANIRPNIYNPNSTEFEQSNRLYNAYSYTLRTPKIPQWQVDRPGVVVIIEFYTSPEDHQLTWSNIHYHPVQFISSTPLW